MAERGILGEVARGNDGTTVTGPSCQCLPRLPCLVRIPIGAVTPLWNGDLRGAVPGIASDQQSLVIAGHDDSAVAGGVAGDGPVGNFHPADYRKGLSGRRGSEAVRFDQGCEVSFEGLHMVRQCGLLAEGTPVGDFRRRRIIPSVRKECFPVSIGRPSDVIEVEMGKEDVLDRCDVEPGQSHLVWKPTGQSPEIGTWSGSEASIDEGDAAILLESENGKTRVKQPIRQPCVGHLRMIGRMGFGEGIIPGSRRRCGIRQAEQYAARQCQPPHCFAHHRAGGSRDGMPAKYSASSQGRHRHD